MTRVEPTEIEELSGSVLGIISAYGMGAALDARDLNLKTAPGAPPPEHVLVPDGGYIKDGVYHVAP